MGEVTVMSMTEINVMYEWLLKKVSMVCMLCEWSASLDTCPLSAVTAGCMASFDWSQERRQRSAVVLCGVAGKLE